MSSKKSRFSASDAMALPPFDTNTVYSIAHTGGYGKILLQKRQICHKYNLF